MRISDWSSDVCSSDLAKARAHKKLAAFTPTIGYPDKWRDYSGLTMKRDDLFGNALRSNQFEFDYQMGKLGKPIYRWEWGMATASLNRILYVMLTPAAIAARMASEPEWK